MQRETETTQRDENEKDRGGPHRDADEEHDTDLSNEMCQH